MLRDKKTKIFALALALVTNLMLLANVDYASVGIYHGCPWANRLTYHFFHAGIVHCLVNAWCFLSCVFLAKVSFPMLVWAFVVAACAPTLGDVPTVGLSGVCYALLGMIMLQSTDKRRYNIVIGMSWLFTALLIPNAANGVHMYCYAVAAASYGMPRATVHLRRNAE